MTLASSMLAILDCEVTCGLLKVYRSNYFLTYNSLFFLRKGGLSLNLGTE